MTNREMKLQTWCVWQEESWRFVSLSATLQGNAFAWSEVDLHGRHEAGSFQRVCSSSPTKLLIGGDFMKVRRPYLSFDCRSEFSRFVWVSFFFFEQQRIIVMSLGFLCIIMVDLPRCSPLNTTKRQSSWMTVQEAVIILGVPEPEMKSQRVAPN